MITKASKQRFSIEALESRHMLTAVELVPFAYAWVDDMTSAQSTPFSDYSYNPTGGDINVTRLSVGSYAVEFEGLRAAGEGGGNVQVTGYGDTSNYCKVREWSFGTTSDDFGTTVDCYDSSGVAADNRFIVSVIHRRAVSTFAPDSTVNSGQFSFAWAGNPSTPSPYTPAPDFSLNASGPITATRMGVGNYSVNFANSASSFTGGTVQVTAYGTSNSNCSVVKWTSFDDFVPSVLCYDPSGTPVDSAFSIAVIPTDSTVLGYAWADQSSSPSYNPIKGFSENPSGLAINASRSATGQYSVEFVGANPANRPGGTVLVTPYGNAAASCNVNNFANFENDFTVFVNCFDATGSPVNSQFTVLILPTPEGDRFEPNDTIEIATDVGSGDVSLDDLSILACGGILEFCSSPDFYAWTAQEGDKQIEVAIDFVHVDGDLNLRLLNQAGEELVSSASLTDDESVRWNVEAGTTYVIQVFGRDGFINDYSLEIDVTPLPELPGDADGSGRVGFEDFAALAANFGRTDAAFADGDFNCDGAVNFADFAILAANFGRRL